MLGAVEGVEEQEGSVGVNRGGPIVCRLGGLREGAVGGGDEGVDGEDLVGPAAGGGPVVGGVGDFDQPHSGFDRVGVAGDVFFEEGFFGSGVAELAVGGGEEEIGAAWFGVA